MKIRAFGEPDHGAFVGANASDSDRLISAPRKRAFKLKAGPGNPEGE